MGLAPSCPLPGFAIPPATPDPTNPFTPDATNPLLAENNEPPDPPFGTPLLVFNIDPDSTRSSRQPCGMNIPKRITLHFTAATSLAIMALSKEEREQFLAEPHIAALSVSAGDKRGPLTVPIWYQYTPGGEPWVITGAGSASTGSSRRRASSP